MASSQVVLQHVAADLALARARAAGEQRRAVEDDAEAAAAVLGRPHLRDQVQQEQQRAVADARQAGAEAAVEALLLGFLADLLLDLLPLHAEGRIGEHVVEVLARQAVVGERVAEDDVGDVLPLDEHVGLADGVGLGVELLPVHDRAGRRGSARARCSLGDATACRRCPRRGRRSSARRPACVSASSSSMKSRLTISRMTSRGREVLAGGLVGELGELADQLLEDRAHLGVADRVGVQVDVGELLGDQVEQAGLGQPVDLGVEVEALEDVAHGRREGLHVGAQVLADVVLVAHQLLHVERRRVVEELARPCAAGTARGSARPSRAWPARPARRPWSAPARSPAGAAR